MCNHYFTSDLQLPRDYLSSFSDCFSVKYSDYYAGVKLIAYYLNARQSVENSV